MNNSCSQPPHPNRPYSCLPPCSRLCQPASGRPSLRPAVGRSGGDAPGAAAGGAARGLPRPARVVGGPQLAAAPGGAGGGSFLSGSGVQSRARCVCDRLEYFLGGWGTSVIPPFATAFCPVALLMVYPAGTLAGSAPGWYPLTNTTTLFSRFLNCRRERGGGFPAEQLRCDGIADARQRRRAALLRRLSAAAVDRSLLTHGTDGGCGAGGGAGGAAAPAASRQQPLGGVWQRVSWLRAGWCAWCGYTRAVQHAAAAAAVQLS